MWPQLAKMLVDRVIIVLLKQLAFFLPKIIAEWIKEREQLAAQAAAKKEHDAVVANPESTPEDIANAYAKYRNAGR